MSREFFRFVVVGAFAGLAVACGGLLGITDLPPATDGDGGDASDVVVPNTWCAMQKPLHSFCKDFDYGNYFDDFTQVQTSTNGKLDSETSNTRSQPAGLRSLIPFEKFNGDYAYMIRTGAAGVSHVTFAFDFWLEALPQTTGSIATVATIVIDAGQSDEHTLAYDVDFNSNDEIEERFGVSASFHGTSYISAPNQWQRIVLDLDLANQSVSTFVGSVTTPPIALNPTWPTSGEVTISIGLSRVNDQTSAWSALYDDVVADWK